MSDSRCSGCRRTVPDLWLVSRDDRPVRCASRAARELRDLPLGCAAHHGDERALRAAPIRLPCHQVLLFTYCEVLGSSVRRFDWTVMHLNLLLRSGQTDGFRSSAAFVGSEGEQMVRTRGATRWAPATPLGRGDHQR